VRAPGGKYYFPVASEDIFDFQVANNLRPTGRIDAATKKALLAAGYVEQDVPANLRKIVEAVKKLGGTFTDPEYLKAVVGNVMKESMGKYVNEDILNWKRTDNDRIRDYFGERIVMAFGPKRLADQFAELRRQGKGRQIKTVYPPDPNANITPEEAQAQAQLLDAAKSTSEAKFIERWSEIIYGHNTATGKELGNTEPGDGFKYRGRGFIGITGKDNYRKRSQEIFGDDRLVSNPELINDPEYGAIAAAYYLRRTLADTKKRLGIPDGPLSPENARVLVTSQISGGDIRRKKIAGEILGKVEQFGQQYAQTSGATPQAKYGGIFDGPMSGYRITMHGNEAVIPLQQGSVPLAMPRDFTSSLIDVNRLVSELTPGGQTSGTAVQQIGSALVSAQTMGSDIVKAFQQMTRSVREQGVADRAVIENMLTAHKQTAEVSQKILQTSL
jgi:hypothetical protein